VEKKAVYLVKDLARGTGLSIHTVKYYLKIGLLHEIGRSPETNFRFFDESTIDRARQICDLRRQGKTIREIQSLVKEHS